VAAPIDENSEVLAALGRYQCRVAALDVSAVQRIYPALAASQVEQLRRSFESTTTYEIALTQPRVDVRNNTSNCPTRLSPEGSFHESAARMSSAIENGIPPAARRTRLDHHRRQGESLRVVDSLQSSVCSPQSAAVSVLTTED
jgi:hypothetical protein